jgi:hypothetical protein
MNPIAVTEVNAAARRAVLGALATDPDVPSETAAKRSAGWLRACITRVVRRGRAFHRRRAS